MSKITCIIVEDEPLAAKVLADYIAQVPFLTLSGIFKDAILATEYLRDHSPDLIFLDIHLPKLKGLAFLKMLTAPPSVIITTAYHQYAVEGFNLSVTDYLLKPIEFERFLIAVNKVKSKQVEKPAGSGTKGHLFLNMQKKKVKILLDDILYIESQREYIKIVTVKKEYITKMSTHEVENRSFIVSINRIESYTSEEIEINGVILPIGRGYRDIIDEL